MGCMLCGYSLLYAHRANLPSLDTYTIFHDDIMLTNSRQFILVTSTCTMLGPNVSWLFAAALLDNCIP